VLRIVPRTAKAIGVQRDITDADVALDER